jgi:hypothetical protein
MHCGSSNIKAEYKEEFIEKTRKQANLLYQDYGVNPEEIVKEEKPSISQRDEEEEVKVSKAVYEVDSLTEETAKKLADWITSQEGEYDVMYDGRKINALLD